MAIDAQWSSVVLLCPFSSDLWDAKSTTLAPVGNVAISATVGTPFGAGNAAAFDGTGDYIPLLDGSQWAFGTGDFTIEVWVYPTSFPGGGFGNDMALFGSLTGAPFPFFYLNNATGVPTLWDGTTGASASVAVTLNVWNYVVASRVSGVLKIGIGGVERYSGAYTTNFTATTGFAVGGQPGSRSLFGYLGPVRVTKGVGRGVTTLPTAPFPRPTISGTVLDHLAAPVAKTVLVYDRSSNEYVGGTNSDPTTGQYTFYPPDFGEFKVERLDELADPYWNDVALAARLTGANGGTSFPVLVGPALSKTGTVTTTTTTPTTDPFGTGSSALFTGAGSYLSTGANAAMLPGTAYTISGWLYLSVLDPTYNGVFFIGDSASDLNRTSVLVDPTGLIRIHAYGTGSVYDSSSAAGVITSGAWIHFASVRNGANALLFVNGVLVVSAIATGTEPTGNNLHLGLARSSSVVRGMQGNLFDVQYTKRAVWLSNFTPPPAPFPVAPADGGSGENAAIYDRVIPG